MKIRLTVVAAVATLLSSFGLYPLFQGTAWAWCGLGAILVVAGTGLLTRRFRLPAVLCLACGLAALHLYLTVLFAASHAFLWIVPTPSSLGKLDSTIRDGWSTANKYAAPVPNLAGVRMLATMGVGAVALLVDFLAVRVRRAAPAGLPLLAMYSVPAAVRQESVGWVPFILGAAGFLALLLADAQEQVSGWGRHVYAARWTDDEPQTRRAWFPERPDASALGVAGRRIGLASMALSLVVPVLIPGIHPKGMFGLGGPNGPGTGTGLVTTPDPLVALRHDLARPADTPMLTYTTDDPDQPEYLRLYALDQFNGETWSYNSWSSTSKDRIKDKPLPSPTGLNTLLTPTRTVTTTISLSKHATGYGFLPLPYAPHTVDIKGDWRVHAPSLMVFGYHTDADGKTFTVTSTQALPDAAELRNAEEPNSSVSSEYLRVPEAIQHQIHGIAVQQGKGQTAFDKAVALQRWFNSSHFSYSLDAPPGSDDLLGFLQNTRTGDCEQFASAMAVLARDLGIPARVAVGFTAGTKVAGKPNEWEVRAGDAHAWPELYFEGAGWVRFEPTPAGAGGTGQGTATVPNYAATTTPETGTGATTTPPTGTTTGPGASASASPKIGHRPDDPETGGSAGAVATKHHSTLPIGWIAGGVVVVLLLAVPMLLRLLTRRRRWAQMIPEPAEPAESAGPDERVLVTAGAGAADTAHAAWAELRSDVIDHGLPWRSSESPRAAAHRLTELLELNGGAAAALERIAHAEERARYARTPAPAHTLRSDVRTMREAFASVVSRRARIRARLAPPTAIASIRAAGTQALDTFDQQAAKIRSRLPHR
jgi:transglutaminase-like putative cysteine protease